jgi:lysophospholipid acyltransferase (LPLAT)-like uncharacterized protein
MYAERGAAAMVSRNYDGQFIIPTFKLRGMIAIRGSGIRQGKASKGGLAALEKIVAHVQTGRPACIAVDGPAGPRGHAHKGVAVLGMRTGAAVVPVVPVSTKKWVLVKAWDRLQIPKPFATITGYFGDPMYCQPGESAEEFRARIEAKLIELENAHEPAEAKYLYRSIDQPTKQHLRDAA